MDHGRRRLHLMTEALPNGPAAQLGPARPLRGKTWAHCGRRHPRCATCRRGGLPPPPAPRLEPAPLDRPPCLLLDPLLAPVCEPDAADATTPRSHRGCHFTGVAFYPGLQNEQPGRKNANPCRWQGVPLRRKGQDPWLQCPCRFLSCRGNVPVPGPHPAAGQGCGQGCRYVSFGLFLGELGAARALHRRYHSGAGCASVAGSLSRATRTA